ncbi:NUDIX hydrolase [Nakamurella flava]|uniref:NUDIX hydrolase n=1 Tax=Nakamurella flava TaxID=2576308 RepID=A0A4U6Q690_9ACTN|nr:NUDIX hydrolase [Nakamurella flava]TKV56153.1 NUDIX hydrolase [Nakamurella flava]
MTAGDGNGWVQCALGHRHWGRFGAAGLLLRRTDPEAGDAGPTQVLLQHRAPWTAHGDTWGLVGGARDSFETAADAAVREAHEEAGVPAVVVRVVDELVDDHGDWSYVTVIAELVAPFVPVANDESLELRWVAETGVDQLDLHPGFARTWPRLRRH